MYLFHEMSQRQYTKEHKLHSTSHTSKLVTQYSKVILSTVSPVSSSVIQMQRIYNITLNIYYRPTENAPYNID